MNSEITDEMLQKEISEAFLRVWETSVGLPLKESSTASGAESIDEWIAGVVWLGGQWTGCVTLVVPKKFARSIAAMMLDVDPTIITIDQYTDAVRELTNMSAGNLKSVLPGACGLATPGCFAVKDPHDDHAPEFSTIASLTYQYLDSPIVVTLKGLH